MSIRRWTGINKAGRHSPLSLCKRPERLAHLKSYQQFLKGWLEWVEAGAPESPVYRTDKGLCDSTLNQPTSTGLILAWRFHNKPFPFGSEEYLFCHNTSTMHKDQNRVNWVKRELAFLKEGLGCED